MVNLSACPESHGLTNHSLKFMIALNEHRVEREIVVVKREVFKFQIGSVRAS